MPKTPCEYCAGAFIWRWEEAFDKYGFNDGDGNVETFVVAEVLEKHGYITVCEKWGLHNVVIYSIKKDGVELIPPGADVGFADPRSYLPAEIIALLDRELPEDGELV
jgi:hypothetical protein